MINLTILKLRKKITIKLLVLSFILSLIFYYFYLGLLSKYLALVCSLMFAGISIYYFLILRNTNIEIMAIKKSREYRDYCKIDLGKLKKL